MREIKFRAWDKRNKKIIYIDESSTFELCINSEKDWSINPYVGLECILSNNDGVLMQFTGLKDKNGKEIYEGDVVDVYGHPMKIVYCTDDDVMAQFCAENLKKYKDEDNDTTMKGYHFDACHWDEIIGNIYENPELLK